MKKKNMGRIKGWIKKYKTKKYTEWRHISLPKAIVVQETKGAGWYIFYIANLKSRKGWVKTIGHDWFRQKAEQKAVAWMRKHPKG